MASRQKTGGRKKGTPNKLTTDRAQRIAETAAAIEGTLPDAFKGDAHAYLMSIYKNATLPTEVRLDAAKAAISYEKPKLAAIQHKGDEDNPLTMAPTVIRLVGVDVDGSRESIGTLRYEKR